LAGKIPIPAIYDLTLQRKYRLSLPMCFDVIGQLAQFCFIHHGEHLTQGMKLNLLWRSFFLCRCSLGFAHCRFTFRFRLFHS